MNKMNTTNRVLTCDGYRSCYDTSNLQFISIDSDSNLMFTGTQSGMYLAIKSPNFNTHDNHEINMLCTGDYSCGRQEIENITSIYCGGRASCFRSDIKNINGSVWGYGSWAFQQSTINNILNNIYLMDKGVCYGCSVSNVNGNIYSFGLGCLQNANISNVNGSIFGLGFLSLADSFVVNSTAVYCASEYACESMTIKSVELIVQTSLNGFYFGTIISDNNKSGTMTVKLYNPSYVLEIICSDNNICKIGCFSEDACYGVTLLCYGTCLVYCDNVDIECPTVEEGTFGIWDVQFNSSTNSGNSSSSNSDNDDGNGNTNSNDNSTYTTVVTIFTGFCISGVVCIIIAVCGWRLYTYLREIKEDNEDEEEEQVEINKNSNSNSHDHDFVIFVMFICISIFLGFICILYGFGQITQIILSNYWCERRDLDEIYEHSYENDLNHGTSEGCWKSKQFTVTSFLFVCCWCSLFFFLFSFSSVFFLCFVYKQVDTSALFDSASIYSTTSDFSFTNIVACVVWLSYGVVLLWTAATFTSLQLTNKLFELSDTVVMPWANNRTSRAPTRTRANTTSTNSCKCFTLTVRAYSKLNRWFVLNFGEDTPNWFILLSIREVIEILLQILAAYNYNGYNLLAPEQVVLPYKDSQVMTFCILLSVNCVFTGILWLCYTFIHKLCHGSFFKQLIFFVDTIFDTFYVIFPIVIVVTNTSGFNLKLAVAVLQSTNLYVTRPS